MLTRIHVVMVIAGARVRWWWASSRLRRHWTAQRLDIRHDRQVRGLCLKPRLLFLRSPGTPRIRHSADEEVRDRPARFRATIPTSRSAHRAAGVRGVAVHCVAKWAAPHWIAADGNHWRRRTRCGSQNLEHKVRVVARRVSGSRLTVALIHRSSSRTTLAMARDRNFTARAGLCIRDSRPHPATCGGGGPGGGRWPQVAAMSTARASLSSSRWLLVLRDSPTRRMRHSRGVANIAHCAAVPGIPRPPVGCWYCVLAAISLRRMGAVVVVSEAAAYVVLRGRPAGAGSLTP